MKSKTSSTAKDEVINVRVTARQKTALTAVAAREGLGVSTWLLHVGLRAIQNRAKEIR